MRVLLIGLAVVLAGCSDLVADNTGANADLAADVKSLQDQMAEVNRLLGEHGEVVQFANYRVSIRNAEKAAAPVFPIARTIFFTSPDCTGTAHLDGGTVSPYGASQGVAFANGSGELMYLPRGTEAVAISRVSFISHDGSACISGDPVEMPEAYPVIANDAAVTCVPDGGFTDTIGRVGQYIPTQSNASQIEVLTCSDYIVMLNARTTPLIVGN